MKQILSANRFIAIVAVLLAISTFAVHVWNRWAQNTTRLQTSQEGSVALFIFVITLLALYVIPLIVALITEKSGNDRKWQIVEVCTVVLGLLIGVMSVSLPGLILYLLHPIIFSVMLVYSATVVAYSFMLKSLIVTWRRQNRGGIVIDIAMNLIGIFIVSLVILAVSAIIVFFE